MRYPWYRGTEAKKKMEENTACRWDKEQLFKRTVGRSEREGGCVLGTCMAEMIIPRCITNWPSAAERL